MYMYMGGNARWRIRVTGSCRLRLSTALNVCLSRYPVNWKPPLGRCTFADCILLAGGGQVVGLVGWLAAHRLLAPLRAVAHVPSVMGRMTTYLHASIHRPVDQIDATRKKVKNVFREELMLSRWPPNAEHIPTYIVYILDSR